MPNCNHILREGNCDGAIWSECTYCGAIYKEPYKVVEKPKPWLGKEKHLNDGTTKLLIGEPTNPYELEAVVKQLLLRVTILEDKLR